MKGLIYIELYKLARSPRTYMSFAIGAGLMLIIHIGLYTEGESIFAFLLESIDEYFQVEGTILNGYLVSYLAMNSLWIHIPILIVIVSAQIVAGEFELGSIRLMLTQPIGRNKFFLAKAFATAVYTVCFMLVISFFAMAPALLIFGSGDLVVFMEGIQIVNEDELPLRFFAALLYSIMAMVSFSCFAMMLSVYYRSTLTAVLISLGMLVLFILLQKFVIDANVWWQNLLFTYHYAKWQLFFVTEIPISDVLISTFVMLLIIGLTLGLARSRFLKMDIF